MKCPEMSPNEKTVNWGRSNEMFVLLKSQAALRGSEPVAYLTAREHFTP